MKTWKNALIGMVAIIAFVFGFVGCKNGNDNPTHTHEWEWVEIEKATYTAEESETETCIVCSETRGTRTHSKLLPQNSIKDIATPLPTPSRVFAE